MISQVLPIDQNRWLIAEQSQPGYHLLDLKTNQVSKLKDPRPDHNSGCTDLLFLSAMNMVLARTRFTMDLISIDNLAIQNVKTELNTGGTGCKLV
jgi:hypothetical protein